MILLSLLNDLSPASSSLGARGSGLIILSTTLDAPVEDVVILIAFTNEEVAEQLAQVRIVGLVVESEGASVVEEDAKLVGEASAKKVGGSRHLLLHDAVVLLLLGGSLQALPWESST